MPVEGFDTITLKDDVIKKAKQAAELQNRTLANYITTLILKDIGVME